MNNISVGATATAVVSGGGTGIGRATALRLAQEGYQIIVLGRREAPIRDVSAEINRRHGSTCACYYSVDLSNPVAVRDMAAQLGRWSGGIQILVNNAGGLGPEPADKGDLMAVVREWESTWLQNTLSAVLLTTALLPFIRTRAGRIVFMSSIAALRGGGDSYGSAKAALHGFAFALAKQLAGSGTTVNVIAPGFIEGTEFFGDSMSEDRRRQLISSIPAGRPGSPDDVAAMVAWLASEGGKYVTGQILQINGGALLGR